MKQKSLAKNEYDLATQPTHKREFRNKMNRAVPAAQQVRHALDVCRLMCGPILAVMALSAAAQDFGGGGQPTSIDFSDLAPGRFIALPGVDIGDAAGAARDESLQGVSLSELVEQALKINPQIQQSKAQQDSAQAQVGVARAELLPSLSLRYAQGPERSWSEATATSARSPSNHDYTSGTVRLTRPIYNPLLKHELSAALQAEEAADLRTRSTQDSMTVSVMKASLDVASARLILDFSDAHLKQLQTILSYLETRTAAGAASQADLERVRTRAYNARQTRLEQQAAYRSALFELERLTGQRPQAIELLSLAKLPPLQSERQVLLDRAFAQNADIRALERDVQAQQLRVQAELARYRPVLGLSLEHDFNRNVGGATPRAQASRVLAVMVWTRSLGDKEMYQAEVANAELRQREARLRDEKLRLAQAVETDHSALKSAMMRVSAARLEQEAAARVVDAVTEQLGVGRLGSLLEALDAGERLFAARQRLAQSISQTIKSHAQLLLRTGDLPQARL